jgi:glycine/D-amino acid oxidase-like deaminating enzyme
MMPRIVQPDAKQSVFYALGYGGNGVSFSAHAGRRMAQRMAGHDDAMFDLPIYDSPLPFPAQGEWAAPFRRFGQSMLYRWYQLRDEVL